VHAASAKRIGEGLQHEILRPWALGPPAFTDLAAIPLVRSHTDQRASGAIPCYVGSVRDQSKDAVMKSIVINNEKGGVGKSTIAVHLAWFFAEMGKRVLFVDLDPQSNASKTLQAHASDVTATAAFRGDVRVVPLDGPGIRVISGDSDLRALNELKADYIAQFKKNVTAAAADFDVGVIDTPPTFNVRNLAALISSDYVIAPIDLDEYAIDGIETLLKSIIGVKQRYNSGLTFLGLMPNRLQATSPRQRENLQMLVRKFGTKYLFDGVIPQRSAFGEALGERKPVWALPKTSAREAGRDIRAVFAKVAEKMEIAP
jgi:chromosome partitioning protein